MVFPVCPRYVCMELSVYKENMIHTTYFEYPQKLIILIITLCRTCPHNPMSIYLFSFQGMFPS
jgi:hypothetical protein